MPDWLLPLFLLVTLVLSAFGLARLSILDATVAPQGCGEGASLRSQ